MDSNIKNNRKQTEQSPKMVCKADNASPTGHTIGFPHLGDGPYGHETPDMARKVDVDSPHKKLGRGNTGSESVQ